MEELREYIRKVGVNRFAKMTGYSPSMVSAVLNGHRQVSRKFAQAAEEASGGYVKKEKLLWPQ